MSLSILLIFYLSLNNISSFIVGAESSLKRSKLERNNILNKGVWVKNNIHGSVDSRPSPGNYFVKHNSLDADNLQQNGFDIFSNDEPQDREASITSFYDRRRRSPEYLRKHRPRKSIKRQTNNIDEPMFTKPQKPEFKPLFNEYPFRIDGLLTTDKEIQHLKGNVANKNATANVTVTSIDFLEINTDVFGHKNKNDTKDATMTTKYDYEVENDLSTTVNVNDTDKTERSKKSNDRFDKRVMWHPNVPVSPETNAFTTYNEYSDVNKDDKIRVTERGLVKVISMLTKTFKKIIRQHSDIKQIHGEILLINNELGKKIDDTGVKFQDFDSKYADMIQFSEKLKKFEDTMAAETVSLQKKQIDMDKNIAEFENQQKKFLTQQRQFYNIQKLMISQNEKINLKQNMIAKSQSEISHRQNNFARILKKAKLVFSEKAPQTPHSTNNDEIKYNNENPKETVEPIQEITTPVIKPSTENIKINLFSIPAKTKLENKDDLILKEKDLPIDELVYKFYFNNTFIDGLMKSKILNNFATATNNVEIARNIQNKRDKFSTLLYPVKDSKIRSKRWIDKLTKQKKKRRHTKEEHSKNSNTLPTTDMKIKDPFRKMAESFCNEIGQNYEKQTLEWCIEKALRRLRFMNNKVFPGPPHTMDNKSKMLNKITKLADWGTSPGWMTTGYNTEGTLPTLIVTTPKMTSNMPLISTPPVTEMQTDTTKREMDIFFPDNDELESNLKKYDLKPDTEGNVYYEGSWHISDLGHLPASESTGISDIMPGLRYSNSKVDLDTFPFNLKPKRHLYGTRLNENIRKHLKTG